LNFLTPKYFAIVKNVQFIKRRQSKLPSGQILDNVLTLFVKLNKNVFFDIPNAEIAQCHQELDIILVKKDI
jgi:hypothetical protein